MPAVVSPDEVVLSGGGSDLRERRVPLQVELLGRPVTARCVTLSDPGTRGRRHGPAALAVSLVGQFAALALDIADRAYVLVTGRVETEGSSDELRENFGELTSTYLGVN